MCNSSAAIRLKGKYFSLYPTLPHPYPTWRISQADQLEFKKKIQTDRQRDKCSIQKYNVNYNTWFCKCSTNSSHEKHKGEETTVWIIHTAATKHT
jgi:hypothetical protein